MSVNLKSEPLLYQIPTLCRHSNSLRASISWCIFGTLQTNRGTFRARAFGKWPVLHHQFSGLDVTRGNKIMALVIVKGNSKRETRWCLIFICRTVSKNCCQFFCIVKLTKTNLFTQRTCMYIRKDDITYLCCIMVSKYWRNCNEVLVWRQIMSSHN